LAKFRSFLLLTDYEADKCDDAAKDRRDYRANRYGWNLRKLHEVLPQMGMGGTTYAGHWS